jgi:hypothetical protein
MWKGEMRRGELSLTIKRECGAEDLRRGIRQRNGRKNALAGRLRAKAGGARDGTAPRLV